MAWPNQLLGRLYCTFVLTIVMLYGHLYLFSILEDLNVFIIHWSLPYKDFLAAPWLNIDIFMLLLLFTEHFIGFHYCIWQNLLGMLQLLPPTFEETIIILFVRTSIWQKQFLL